MMGREKGADGPIRVAGDKIGSVSDVIPGPGTFARGQFVFAAVSGVEQRRQEEGKAEGQGQRPRPRDVVQVVSPKAPSVLPRVGTLVLAQVSRVSTRVANVDIVGIDGETLASKFAGVVRAQDVRATEIDKVELHCCFRPGDLILARVLALGDARAYYLTTATNDLGVVFARSTAGCAMAPLSWQEMVCPLTWQREPRKVAKREAPPQGNASA